MFTAESGRQQRCFAYAYSEHVCAFLARGFRDVRNAGAGRDVQRPVAGESPIFTTITCMYARACTDTELVTTHKAPSPLQGVKFDLDLPQCIRLEFAKSNTKVSKPKQQSPPAGVFPTTPGTTTFLHPFTGRKFTGSIHDCMYMPLLCNCQLRARRSTPLQYAECSLSLRSRSRGMDSRAYSLTRFSWPPLAGLLHPALSRTVAHSLHL